MQNPERVVTFLKSLKELGSVGSSDIEESIEWKAALALQ